MTAERRPARDVRAEDDDEQDDQADERDAARVVADVDRGEGKSPVEDDPSHRQDRIPGWQAGPAATQPGAEAGGCEARSEDDRDCPAPILGQHVVRHVVDLLVLDPDHALGAEILEDHALPDEQSRRGETDDGTPTNAKDEPRNPANAAPAAN